VANIKSQIKRIKTNERARLRNKAVKSELKTAIRAFRDAAKSGDKDAAAAALAKASRRLGATDPDLRAFVAEPGRVDRLHRAVADLDHRWPDAADPWWVGRCPGRC